MVNWKQVGKNFVRGGIIGVAAKGDEEWDGNINIPETVFDRNGKRAAKEGEAKDCYGRVIE